MRNGNKTCSSGCKVGDIPTKVPPHTVSLHEGFKLKSKHGINIWAIRPTAPGDPQSATKSLLEIWNYFGLNTTSVLPLKLPVILQPGII